MPLTLVCKKFNDVISNSPKLMQKLHLIINEKSKLNKMKKSIRVYRALDIKFHYKLDEGYAEIAKQFTKIKSLELTRCIIPVRVFEKLLRSLPNLEELSIYTTFLQDKNQDHNIKKSKLNKLKTLNFRNTDEMFLSFLSDAPSLCSLNISFHQNYPPDKVLEFIKAHSNIQAIENISLSSIDSSFMTFVISGMNRLEKVAFEMGKLNMDQIRTLEIFNYSIKHLNLYGDASTESGFNDLLNFFRNLRSIEIEMNTNLNASCIAQLRRIAPELESLIIIRCIGDYFININQPKLRLLKLTDGNFSINEWRQLAVQNSTIETLIIKDEALTDDTFRTICLDFHDLKCIEVLYDPQRLTNQTIDFISSLDFPRNIRCVKINQRSYSLQSFFNISDEQKLLLEMNPGFRLILS